MCNFLSALVTRQGELLCNPFLNSHEDLIDYFKVNDKTLSENFVRIEYRPRFSLKKQEGENALNYFDIDKYVLKVDETNIPEWFLEYKPRIIEELQQKLSNMIIDEVVDKPLCNGVYMVRNSHISWIRYAKIITLEDSKVDSLGLNSIVERMSGHSKICRISDNGAVGVMRDQSHVEILRHSAHIEVMTDQSTVSYLKDFSTINRLCDKSKVLIAANHSIIEVVRDLATVSKLNDYAKVVSFFPGAEVSKIGERCSITYPPTTRLTTKVAEEIKDVSEYL